MPRPPSGSIMRSAKLLVLGGAFDQASGGEMLFPSPPLRQLLPAYFAGSIASSLSAGEVSVKSLGVSTLTFVAAATGSASSATAARLATVRRGRLISCPFSDKFRRR